MSEHAQKILLWRGSAMKLLKVLLFFLLLGGDFRLKPASLEANFPQPAPRVVGTSNILFAPCSQLLDRPSFIGVDRCNCGCGFLLCDVHFVLNPLSCSDVRNLLEEKVSILNIATIAIIAGHYL